MGNERMKPGGEGEGWWIVVLDTAAPDGPWGDAKEEVGDAATEKEGMGNGSWRGGKTRRGEGAERTGDAGRGWEMETGGLLTSAHGS